MAQGKRNIEGNLSGPLRSMVRNYFIARTFKKPASDGRRTLWMHEHHIDWHEPVVAVRSEHHIDWHEPVVAVRSSSPRR
ncbi:hypothetical protein [Streptomyces sp. OR43]|uniref:hypothetical protein n=1 Tax=Streptomyces sp. or43 TaxID=2478957 RepID=UPI001650E727|nr:hypothetical protein [Streptomyces sp. or43]